MGPGRLLQLASLRISVLATLALAFFFAGRLEAQSSLNPAWEPLGPVQVESLKYGKVTGRVTALAIDSAADATGNTVYLGATGGGVWKSTNAMGAAGVVTFAPLTDNLPVFSANAGTVALPSLSIGALAAMNNVVLAGTGDPNNATDSFYGEGILRSADGGLTWTLVQDSDDGVYGSHSFVGLAFAGFAWSTTSPGTVAAAVTNSAEGTLVGAASATGAVMGLYVSTDSGVTWTMATVMDGATTVQSAQLAGANHGGNAATALLWNPVRKKFYAALRYHGYYESADGVTWTRLSSQPGAGLTTAACPANTNTVGSNGCPIFRGALAVEPASGDLYALTVDGSNRDLGLWRDACAKTGSTCASSTVSFAQRVGGTSLEAGSGSTVVAQSDYNLSLAAISAGSGSSADTLIFAGTVDLYRCALSACATMRNTTNALNACNAPAKVSPAQHALAAWATTAQPTLFVGNDGGLWRSSDGVNQQGTACSSDDSTHFENLNGALGSLAMAQSLAQHPSDNATLLAGMNANGTAATTTAAANTATAWTQLAAGEGGNVAIDPANPSLWYIATAAGVNIARCASGSSCTASSFSGTPTIGATQTGGDLALTHAPWLLDPNATSNMIVGTCRVWRGQGEGGGLWSAANTISAMLAGTAQPSCLAANGLVRSLAAGGAAAASSNARNMGSKVIYAGMAGTLSSGASAGGHVFVTQAADTASTTTAWSDVTSSPVTTGGTTSIFNAAGYDISSLVIDPHDATGRTVYATIRGFGVPHVYRSTTAGAGWTVVSRNLPDVPANAVLVDPNDANTVYVAMDSGVYVTKSITTCETTNCWSVYGTGLPNAPVMALAAGAGLATSDGRTGELRAATYGRGVWQVPLLSASSPVTAPTITLSSASLSFPSQPVGTASATQTLTVTNTGVAPLAISQITISTSQLPLGPQAEFTETSTCGGSIAVGQSCTVDVRFLPAATGARSATMTIYANVSGGQATVSLTGTATPGGALVLTPVSLVFGQVGVNATSAAQNITVSNTGTASITLGTAAVSGDFLLTANTCGSTLATQTGCTISVVFRPLVSGARSGSLTISGDGTMLTSSFTGTGVLPATDALAPLALIFGAQDLGTTSLSQQVTLTNAGDVALTLIAAATTGDFAVSNGCGNSLAAHASCAMTVVFQPKSLGQATGVLTVSDETRSQTVSLSGIGIAPAGVSLSPLFSMAFPATGVGLASSPQTVTLTNNGGVPLAISAIAVTGDFAIVPGSSTCGAALAAGSACTMQVAFQPTRSGTRNGTLTVVSNATNSPHSLALSGPGMDFTLAPDGVTTATVASGQSASYLLLYTSGAAVAGTNVALSCSGAPQYATCRVSPATLAVDGNATVVTVTIATGTTAAFLQHGNSVLLALLLCPAGWFVLRRRSRIALLCVCVLVAAQGCGAGRTIPASAGGGGSGSGTKTPGGSYNVIVTASGYGLTRSVGLTLNVQ